MPKHTIKMFYSETCSHCTPPYTVISGSYRSISEIRERDSCLGISGHVKVLNTFKRPYRGKLVIIKTRGLLPLELTPEHPVLVVTGLPTNKRTEFTKPYWKPARDLIPKRAKKKGDYLLVPRVKGEIDIDKLSLQPYTTQRGVNDAEAKGYPTSFPLNYETAWLLGLYVAEGDATEKAVRFHLGKHERKLVQRLCKTIQMLGYHPRVVENRTTTSVELSSRILARAFKDWCGRTAENKHIPQFVLYHKNVGVVKSFLKGYVDGDGYVKSNFVGISTVSRVLALQIQLLNARLGNIAKIYHCTGRKHYIEGRRINARDIYRVEWFHSKYHRGAILNDFIAYPVKDVEFIDYNGTVHNLETADETYLAFNAVVHNCKRVLPLLQEFEQQHPEVSVELIEATTERQTKHLAAILGGKKPEVPTAVIDGKYLVVGETNFIERISFALKLAEKTPPLQEEKSRWLLRT